MGSRTIEKALPETPRKAPRYATSLALASVTWLAICSWAKASTAARPTLNACQGNHTPNKMPSRILGDTPHDACDDFGAPVSCEFSDEQQGQGSHDQQEGLRDEEGEN